MASRANLVVVGSSLLPTGDVVRIMASGAAKLSFALQKAFRFPKPIARMCDFETGILARFTIEIHFEVRQGLSRPIRERTALQADNRVGQFLIRRFQVALQ